MFVGTRTLNEDIDDERRKKVTYRLQREENVFGSGWFVNDNRKNNTQYYSVLVRCVIHMYFRRYNTRTCCIVILIVELFCLCTSK